MTHKPSGLKMYDLKMGDQKRWKTWKWRTTETGSENGGQV